MESIALDFSQYTDETAETFQQKTLKTKVIRKLEKNLSSIKKRSSKKTLRIRGSEIELHESSRMIATKHKSMANVSLSVLYETADLHSRLNEDVSSISKQF